MVGFVGLGFTHPSADVEARIVVGETGVAEDVARKLVTIARKVRTLTDLAVLETVSTRLLVDAAQLMVHGLPNRFAAYVAIAEPLTDDADTLAAIRQVIDLVL